MVHDRHAKVKEYLVRLSFLLPRVTQKSTLSFSKKHKRRRHVAESGEDREMRQRNRWVRLVWILAGLSLCLACQQGGGCNGKGLAGTKYVLRCISSAVHCKGKERRFQTTKCFPNGNKELVDTALKESRKSAHNAYTSGGTCTKDVTWNCYIQQETYGDCTPAK